VYTVVSHSKEGVAVADKSRAEYYRNLRKIKKQLVFMVDKEKAEALDAKLAEKGQSRIDWMREKIDEELGLK
jgi:hypothetical protein